MIHKKGARELLYRIEKNTFIVFYR